MHSDQRVRGDSPLYARFLHLGLITINFPNALIINLMDLRTLIPEIQISHVGASAYLLQRFVWQSRLMSILHWESYDILI